MSYVYLLRCADDSIYVGSTWAIEHRVDQHNAGQVKGWTSARLPVRLLWYAEFDRIDEAYAMEVRIKGWSRRKKLALVDGRFDDLHELARCRSSRRPR